MADFVRPTDRYWIKNGVYEGQAYPGYMWDTRIEPVYVVCVLGPGTRDYIRGRWRAISEGGTRSIDVALTWYSRYMEYVRHGSVGAVTLVCLMAHSRPGEDGGEVSVVVRLGQWAGMVDVHSFDPAPGMESLHGAVVAAARRLYGAADSDYVRPDPSDLPVPPVDDLPVPDAEEVTSDAAPDA